MRPLLAALCALLLGACAGGPRLGDLQPSPARNELLATPFFPQDEFQCGPAALATALVASGATATPAELVPRIYLPERKGSLQPEIVATARAYGRVPYRINGTLSDLVAEVAAGNPVLVLQNLGFGFWPAWHYAVVIGYDAHKENIVLRSGTERRLVTSTSRFDRSWRLAERWGLVLARPGSPPATANASDWLQAASAFEELKRADLAATAYEAATRRWPDQAMGWQLLGNARYAQGDRKGAAAAFRSALEREDSPATRNNLAHVLMELGCAQQALAHVVVAIETLEDQRYAEALQRTRNEIERGLGRPGANKDCAP